jgi:hypothetical protein
MIPSTKTHSYLSSCSDEAHLEYLSHIDPESKTVDRENLRVKYIEYLVKRRLYIPDLFIRESMNETSDEIMKETSDEKPTGLIQKTNYKDYRYNVYDCRYSRIHIHEPDENCEDGEEDLFCVTSSGYLSEDDSRMIIGISIYAKNYRSVIHKPTIKTQKDMYSYGFTKDFMINYNESIRREHNNIFRNINMSCLGIDICNMILEKVPICERYSLANILNNNNIPCHVKHPNKIMYYSGYATLVNTNIIYNTEACFYALFHDIYSKKFDINLWFYLLPYVDLNYPKYTTISLRVLKRLIMKLIDSTPTSYDEALRKLKIMEYFSSLSVYIHISIICNIDCNTCYSLRGYDCEADYDTQYITRTCVNYHFTKYKSNIKPDHELDSFDIECLLERLQDQIKSINKNNFKFNHCDFRIKPTYHINTLINNVEFIKLNCFKHNQSNMLSEFVTIFLINKKDDIVRHLLMWKGKYDSVYRSFYHTVIDVIYVLTTETFNYMNNLERFYHIVMDLYHNHLDIEATDLPYSMKVYNYQESRINYIINYFSGKLPLSIIASEIGLFQSLLVVRGSYEYIGPELFNTYKNTPHFNDVLPLMIEYNKTYISSIGSVVVANVKPYFKLNITTIYGPEYEEYFDTFNIQPLLIQT